MKRKKTQAAIAWHEIVGQLPCVLCRRLHLTQRSPTEVHHDTISAGMAQRAGDFLVAALCRECHRGPHAVHGDKQRLHNAKVKEADLVNDTIALAFADMARVMGHQVGGAPDAEGEAMAVLGEIITDSSNYPVIQVDPIDPPEFSRVRIEFDKGLWLRTGRWWAMTDRMMIQNEISLSIQFSYARLSINRLQEALHWDRPIPGDLPMNEFLIQCREYLSLQRRLLKWRRQFKRLERFKNG